MRAIWTRAVLVFGVGLVGGGAVGCAEEREPVSRVQANALAKSFFIGASLGDPSDDPEFWTQGTVIDVGYGAAQDGLFNSTYAQPMSRIKWVVQEGYLVARATYELIEDSDHKGLGPASSDGQVAAIYPILSHFDIRRDYNPTTGEESNVLVENTTDRPWYEREYMRVDWSRNLNTDAYGFDTLSLLGVYGGVDYEPISYYVNDPSHPDAPYFDPNTGYFDITNKAFATPKQIDLSKFGWGIDSFPACFLDNDFMGGSSPSGNCNPVEITIRQSFRRVVDNDYEPQDWDGLRFQAFGAFTVERKGYARNYGMSDDKWHRFITRYNIWERSHAYADPAAMTGPVACFTPETTPVSADPHRDEDGNGTEDECEAVGGGSRCDVYMQKCTLPFRNRVAVPQPWYYSKGSNLEFFDPTGEAAHEWDVAMRAAVQAARYVECTRTTEDADPVAISEACANSYPIFFGQMDDQQDAVALAREVDICRGASAWAGADCSSVAELEATACAAAQAYVGSDCDALADELGAARGYSAGAIAIAKQPEMIVLCHSPVQHGDSPLCGPEGLTVRQGDLRYHQVNVFTEPQSPSAWGIYTDSEDPLTGEKIAASINVWSHVNDLFAQGVVDTVRYINGELTTADVTDGTFVRDWVQANEIASSGGALPRMTAADMQRSLARVAGVAPDKGEAKSAGGELSAADLAAIRAVKRDIAGIRADVRVGGEKRAIYEARRRSAAGTEFEAALMTAPMQQLAGVDGLPMSEGLLQAASVLRGASPGLARDLRNWKEVALAERGACMLGEAPPPVSLTGLADVLEQKFGRLGGADDDKATQLERAEKMRRYVARKAHYAVIAHEMGHSIGLRHNFVSSADAWGYRPQYWQLRTKNGTVTQQCKDLQEDGEECVGERYFDPVTEAERENMIWTWMQSSTMDYPGDPTQDMIGIGAFDFAAARMFYGESVSVHADASYNRGKARGRGMTDKMDLFGGILGIQPSIGTSDIHYSQLQKAYDLIGECKKVDVEDFKPASWNESLDGEWSPLLDGAIVTVDGQTTRCRQQKVDYVSWLSLETAPNAYENEVRAVDPHGRTRLPYGFATDSWADVGNLSVYRHDNGADPYELFAFFIGQQEVGHIFDNFRRGRQSFSVRSASARTLGRYNEKMRDAAKGLGLIANIYRDVALQEGKNFDGKYWATVVKEFPMNTLAAGVGFDHFTRQMARPESGPHLVYKGDPILRSAEDEYTGGAPEIVIPNGASGYRVKPGTAPGAAAYAELGIGGRPLENRLPTDRGEYDRDYTLNCGSYYDKVWAGMLLTESVDNFISDSRLDFNDARYRSVSMADLFPDGFRRFLANNLTGDDFIKGPRLVADAAGKPIGDELGACKKSSDCAPGYACDTNSEKCKLDDPDCVGTGCRYPSYPLGWTSWWPPAGPEVCFPGEGSMVCSAYGQDGAPFEPVAPANTVVVDPQVGWEQQKFLIAMTLMHLPENQQQGWLDQIRIWELGSDADPQFDNRIEFHHPTGEIYVAKTYGKETLFGKTVQMGIGARVLEYANELLAAAYVTTPGPDADGDGSPEWHIPAMSPTTGQPLVKFDATVQAVPGCTASDNSKCTCSANRACVALSRYVEVPFFIRQALAAYGLADPDQKGIWN